MRPIAEISEALGLPRSGAVFSRAEGLVDGFALTLEERAQRGNEDDLLITAALPHPTDLGMHLAQGGTVGFAPHPLARPGHAAFDGVIDVSAVEPEAACALMTDAVRADVLEMVGLFPLSTSDPADE